jgi:hypothetical protein
VRTWDVGCGMCRDESSSEIPKGSGDDELAGWTCGGGGDVGSSDASRALL